MTNLNGQTLDILQENIGKLRELFPEVATEDKVDFDKLKQILGEYVDDSKERYNFSWNGKGKALRLSQTPSLGTLRPCPEESKDWDTTQNLYIEGDNLEVLKLLQKSYHNKIKMIYIDPPYNTGGDFVYPDDFSESLENYKKITGQVDFGGNRISTNTEARGRYHTDWLNMIYPRLRLARNLLMDNGIIFFSIDDNEVDNLKKICNEVFGEDNFITQISVLNNPKGRSQDKFVATCHEFILCYSKSALSKGALSIEKTDDEINKDYTLADNNGLYRELELRNTHREFGKHNRPNLYYPFYVYEENNKVTVSIVPISQGIPVYPIWEDGFSGCWTWGQDKATNEANLITAKKVNGSWKIYRKSYATQEDGNARKQVKSIWIDKKFHTEKGQAVVNGLLGTKEKIFQSPKSVDLIIELIKMSQAKENDIILDFFSGSASTAHAVMQLNTEDGGNRKFIVVQLPEPCAEDSEAFKAGYKNICEIGKERIRRAGDKIKEDTGLTAQNLDIGFKVLKLDTSNLRKWQPDYDNLEQTLMDSISNFVDGRSEMDVVYEIILKMGLNLTYPIEETVIGGKKVYSVGFGALMMCLDDEITTDVANGMVHLHKEQQPETWKVVFKDNGFKSDSNKTNIKEMLKCAGLDEDAFTTI